MVSDFSASILSKLRVNCFRVTLYSRLCSEEDAKKAARRIARQLQNMGYRIRLSNFRVVNVLGTCTFPFGIRITTFSSDHKEARYVAGDEFLIER